MAIYKTYIQQIKFDGITYTKGSVVDILSTYKVMCQEEHETKGITEQGLGW